MTTDDVLTRLGRPATDATEEARIAAFIEDATALVCDYCGTDFQQPTWDAVPGSVKAAVCSEVIRWLSVSPGTVMEKTGDLQVEYAQTAFIAGLSESAKSMLSRYRKRLGSIRLITWTEVDPDGAV
ncbi:hypothetical protein ACFYY2_12235 [Streptomyces sp. NPDC001822]|uniref:hypothetical protein n=1 Tax=Streptomyces sp. NPDC001822 TaxID=3364614 RepID=UPI0036B917B2